MTVRDVVCHQLNAVSRKRCLMSFSQAPILPCSRALLFALLLSTPAAVNAQWEPDRRLTFNPRSSFSYGRCLAASGQNLHLVWTDERDGQREVYYKRSTDGGTRWEADVRLSDLPCDSWWPTIGVFRSTVHVAWTDRRNGNNEEIYYKRSTDWGISWSLDTQLTSALGESWGPCIGISGPMVHVAWLDARNGGYRIFYKRSSDAGLSWFPDTCLSEIQGAWNGPSLAVSGSVVHVAWEDRRVGNPDIFYKLSTDGGLHWSPDIRLTTDTSYSMTPSLAISDSLVHVVWKDLRDGNYEIYYKRSTDGGFRWSRDSRLTYNSSYSETPSVDALGPGVHVVWHDWCGSNYEVYYLRSMDNGTSWDSLTRLSYAPNSSEYPSVCIAGPAVHVVWRDDRDTLWSPEIYYTRNPTGNSGVEDSSGRFKPLTSNLYLSVVPNPFTSFTSIPGHSSERFALYDISGRKVGVYKGDRIGWDVSLGVYFLRAEKGERRPVRIVKLR